MAEPEHAHSNLGFVGDTDHTYRNYGSLLESEKASDAAAEVGTSSSQLEISTLRSRTTSTGTTADTFNLQGNVENGIGSTEADPFLLTGKKMSEAELKEIKVKGKSRKGVLAFYRTQNDLIDQLIAPIEEVDGGKEDRQDFKVKIAIYISVFANVVLFGMQLAAAIMSGSMALFATTADAFMDLLSSLILLLTRYLAGKKEVYDYPSGKGKFETIGIIIFGSMMSTVSLQLMIHVTTSIFSKPQSPDLGFLSIFFVSFALFTKFILFLYCRLLSSDPSAKILAQDHRNDLLVNSTGLALSLLGDKVNPMIDPIGGLLIALLIFTSWSSTVLEHCRLIVGKCADPDILKRLTYIAMTHDPTIRQVDTCRAYHAGEKVIVEVDIVLPPETTLQVAHDLGESLQVKLESLPNVARAFVHVDYETTHQPEHNKWL